MKSFVQRYSIGTLRHACFHVVRFRNTGKAKVQCHISASYGFFMELHGVAHSSHRISQYDLSGEGPRVMVFSLLFTVRAAASESNVGKLFRNSVYFKDM